MIDSGGYSIIVGDVPVKHIMKFIGTYHEYQEKARNEYDYIMTLDIPLIIGDEEFNTKKNVQYFNHRSLSETKENLIRYPEIREKLYFVWQFKTKEQYDLWDVMYQDLELNNFVKHRALGGMVGLRGLTGIRFSPFIANSFRCLLDHQESRISTTEFRLHYLGIYIKYDRFIIAFLEKLFQRYLGDNHRVILSYGLNKLFSNGTTKSTIS